VIYLGVLVSNDTMGSFPSIDALLLMNSCLCEVP
jgi:hypothetical protein